MTSSLLPLEEDSLVSTDIADVDNATIELEARWNGPCCEKCEAPIKSDGVAVCRRCGWYPLLSRFVDVDSDWEVYDEEAEPTAAKPAPSHAEVWLNLLPRWAWIMIATSAAIVVESVAVRLFTVDGSDLRTAWSVSQLVVGAMTFSLCHILTFLFAVGDDADTGAFDFIVRPLKLWIKAFRALPSRLWVANAAAAGLMAGAMSLIVIGGLPYERLWDWGFKQPVQPNLMGAVMSQVQKVEGTGKDMEGAIQAFAGQAGVADGQVPTTPTPPPKPRLTADCVILGYRVGSGGRLQSLVLGTAFGGKLVYACTVTPQLSDKESAGLLQMLEDSQSPQAYLSVPIEAQWVVPKYSCRVTYESRQKDSGRLLQSRWESFAGAMR